MPSVLVLIAAPGSGAITAEVVQLMRDFGAMPPRWLAPAEACELAPFSRMAELSAVLKSRAIDAAVVNTTNRRKRMLIADMDSTMIQQECIDELGVVAGVGDHIKAVTAKAMRGELDFEAALQERVALLKDLPSSVVGQVLRERIQLMPGGKVLLQTMKAQGAYAALVSGGFQAFTGPIAEQLGFDENRANILEVSNGKLTGRVTPPILGKEAKVEALLQISARLGFSTEQVLAVGDGANDIPMLQEAGMGVALHAKPVVQEQVSLVVNHGDLTALLYLQGYRKDEFAIA
jgi:phosphoserine phosphatase